MKLRCTQTVRNTCVSTDVVHQIIRINPDAPLKPPLGKPCNGCGVCCLAEPCPVGVLLSRRAHGACVALSWDDSLQRYRCGVLAAPDPHSGPLRRWLERSRARWGARLISAGQGCDSDAEVDADLV